MGALCFELVLNLFRALVLIRFTTGFSVFFQLPSNKATFQIDQMFPVTISGKQFLINYRYKESQLILLITMMDDTLYQ